MRKERTSFFWKLIRMKMTFSFNIYSTELQLLIPEINMENITMMELTIPVNLNYQPRDAGISSATLRMYSQLITKTKDGMIILLGFK